MKYRFFQNCITYNEVADYLTEKTWYPFGHMTVNTTRTHEMLLNVETLCQTPF